MEIINSGFLNLATLKAYYRFEAGALTTDTSGEGHTLTAISDPAEDTGGKYRGCVSLDGDDAYSATDHSDFKPTGAYSLSAWIKSNSGAEDMIVASYSQNTAVAGIYMWINASGKLESATGNNTGTTVGVNFQQITSGTSVNDNAWRHVVVTWNTTHLNLYVNGVADATAVAWENAPAYAATNYVRVGCRSVSGSNALFFTGLLDEVAVFNGLALSASQVKDLYEEIKGGSFLFNFV